MIACAVIVSNVHEPLTLWSIENKQHTVTLPFISRNGHTAVRTVKRL